MKLLKKIGEVPHLFSKVIVLWCIAFGSTACAYALRILSRTGHDPTALLGVILAFAGGELLMLCLRKVLNEKQPREEAAEPKELPAENENGLEKKWEDTV